MEKAETLHFGAERREHPRFLIELPVEYLRAKDSRNHPGHTINFSETGFMVSVSEQMEIGEQLEMKIYFSSGSSLITIATIVEIVWRDGEAKENGFYRFGVNFVNILPVDMERLKAFLSLHADPHQAPAELKAPAGSRLNLSKPSAPGQARRRPKASPSILIPFKRLLGLGMSAIGKVKTLITL